MSSSNTFSNLSCGPLALYIVCLIASQTEKSCSQHLFLHGSHFHLFNKSRAHTVQIGVVQLRQFLQFARFPPKQSSWHVKTSHWATWPAMWSFFSPRIENLLVHSSPSKAFKVVCVLCVYQCLFGPPRAELQPLLCSVNWTFGCERLRNSRPNR